MELKNIESIASKIDGWLTGREGELLFNLAKNCTGKGVIVEIGSWKGKSTIYLGLGSKAGKQVVLYAIDPHSGSSEHKEMFGIVWTFQEFQDNIKNAGLNDIVNPIIKTSEKAATAFNEPVELIFIDGAHEYDLVKLDYQLWFPKVIEGGIIAFHDSVGWPGPKKVIEEFILKSGHFKNISRIDSITFAQKVETNFLLHLIQNRCDFIYTSFLEHIAVLIIKLKLPSVIRVLLKSIYDTLKRLTYSK
ncbi:MAG: class I SAM-dependent methyltransferase [Dehalococcoidia bacterium]|jgi:predicted O-methyltransferase YrrM